MREPEDMRVQIMLINERAPEQEIFSVTDTMKICGRSRKFVKKHLMYDCNNICKAKLANRLCKL